MEHLPLKNVAFEFDVQLVSTANANKFQANPTLALGDFQVSTDHGAFENTTLPVVDPAGDTQVKVSLSADQMNGEHLTVRWSDQAGDEWADGGLYIVTLPFDGGVVAAAPAPTLTTFSAQGSLNTDAAFPGYNDAFVYWLEGPNAKSSYKITSYSHSAGTGAFTVSPMPNAPVAGNRFIILGKVG